MSEVVRVLLDECVPGRLKRELPGFFVRTVREHGWASTLDGSLLRAADAEFDVLVTVDRNLIHQQNLSGLSARHHRSRSLQQQPPGAAPPGS